MKKLLIVVGVLVVLIAAAVGVGFFMIDGIAATAIEDAASDATQTEAALDAADIKVFGGSATLTGLTIDNPEGFGEQPFFSLRQGTAKVALGTLLDDTVEIPSVTLDGMQIRAELVGGKLNLLEVLNAVNSTATGGGAATADAKGYIIRELKITNTTVVGSIKAGPIDEHINLTLGEIVLKDVGSDTPGGVALKQVIGQVLRKVLPEAIEGIKGKIPAIGDVVGGIEDVAGQAVDDARGAVDDAVGGLGDRINDAAGGDADGEGGGLGNLRDRLPGGGD